MRDYREYLHQWVPLCIEVSVGEPFFFLDMRTYMRSWSEETRFVRPAMLTLELSVDLDGRPALNGNLRSRKTFHRPIRGPVVR